MCITLFVVSVTFLPIFFGVIESNGRYWSSSSSLSSFLLTQQSFATCHPSKPFRFLLHFPSPIMFISPSFPPFLSTASRSTISSLPRPSTVTYYASLSSPPPLPLFHTASLTTSSSFFRSLSNTTDLIFLYFSSSPQYASFSPSSSRQCTPSQLPTPPRAPTRVTTMRS